jgi:O-antigen ligase
MNGLGAGLRTLGFLPLLIGLAAALGVALYLSPPPSTGIVLAGGIGTTAVIALAIFRYERAALLGFALLGIVLVQPAPPDFVLVIVIAIAAVTGRIDLSRVRPIIGLLLVTFVSLNVISMFEIIDVGRAALFFSITLYLVAFAVWLCSFVNSPDRARIVVVGYVFAATASAVIGLASVGLPVPFRGQIYYNERVQAFFQDPNVFGPFLVPAAAIMLQETIEPRLIRLRPAFKLLIIGTLLGGVLFSFSRGAWINAVVAIVVVFAVTAIRRGGARRAGRLLAVTMITGGLLLAIFSAIGSVKFLDERAALQQYDTERFSAQRTGIELATQNPIGIGPGQFEAVSPLSTHSIYVRVLAEQGLLGFMVVLALLLVTLLLATQNALAGRSTFGIGSAALLGSWAGILVNSLVVDTAHWRHLWLIAPLIWLGSMPFTRPGSNPPAAYQEALPLPAEPSGGDGANGARSSGRTTPRPGRR